MTTPRRPRDPVEDYPELFMHTRRGSGWPAWLTFERVMSTVAAICGAVVLIFQLGGWATLTERDRQDLARELRALEVRVKTLESLDERHDGRFARKDDLASLAREIERIRNRLER